MDDEKGNALQIAGEESPRTRTKTRTIDNKNSDHDFERDS